MMRISFLSTLAIVFCFKTTAQPPSKSSVDKIVNTVAEKIEEHYVIAEKGASISAYFIEDLKKGRFYGTENLKKLDSIMTVSLREVSEDLHLYTWNNREKAQELKAYRSEEKADKTSMEDGQEEVTSFFNDQKAYDSNFGFEKVEVLPGNIGFIKLSQINISTHSIYKLYAAMQLVENTSGLIIDLRNNGGGGSTMGPVLETFFFDKQVDFLEFRTRNGQTEISSTVPWLMEKRYLKPLFVLINNKTGSAAEAFAFALQKAGRCKIVGTASSGGAFMNTYFPVNDDFIVAISTAAPFLPGTTESWEGKGVQPDFSVNDDQAITKAIELIQGE